MSANLLNIPNTKPFGFRRFVLRRTDDVSGSSGTGIVAQGVEFWNGKVAVSWFPGPVGVSTTQQADSVADLIAVHGHEGRTVIDYIDMETTEPTSTPTTAQTT